MKAESLIPLGVESFARSAREAILSDHQTVADLYDSIDSPDLKTSVSAYIAHDATLAKVEAAVSAQYQIITAPTSATEARKLALSRVREGMEYWKKLIRKKMGKL